MWFVPTLATVVSIVAPTVTDAMRSRADAECTRELPSYVLAAPADGAAYGRLGRPVRFAVSSSARIATGLDPHIVLLDERGQPYGAANASPRTIDGTP